MARNSKIFIIIIISCFINFCVSFDAHAKAICKAPVFYKWKHDASYKQENREILKKIPQKLKKEKVRESYWGVIVAEGDKKEDAEKNLNYMLLEKQGDILSECKLEHESFSGCISSKYKKLKTDLESSSFIIRKQIEDSIKLDCENIVGDCQGVVKRDVLCEEIKEINPEEEETDDKSKNGKKGKKDNSKKGKK